MPHMANRVHWGPSATNFCSFSSAPMHRNFDCVRPFTLLFKCWEATALGYRNWALEFGVTVWEKNWLTARSRSTPRTTVLVIFMQPTPPASLMGAEMQLSDFLLDFNIRSVPPWSPHPCSRVQSGFRLFSPVTSTPES